MVLIQLPVYWDDIAGATGLTSLTPQTVYLPVNAYAGPYRAKVDSISYYTTSVTPNIIKITSSKMAFPGSGSQGLLVPSNPSTLDPSLAGHKEFAIISMNGSIDLTLSIQQFDARLKKNDGTWNQSGFVWLLLTLDITPCHPLEEMKKI
jgi:hypothetical protein